MTSYPRSRQRNVSKQYTMFTTRNIATGIDTPSIGRILSTEFCADSINSRFPFEGGPFCVRRVEYVPGLVGGTSRYYYESTTTGTKGGTEFQGFHIPWPDQPSSLPAQSTCESKAKGFGASAWKRFAPHPHSISLAESFFELKETFQSFHGILKGLRHLRTNSRKPHTISQYASAYLGVEFGWKPFISDLRKLLKSIKVMDDQIASAQRLNNRWVTRSGQIVNATNVLGSFNTSPYVSPSNYITDQIGHDTDTSSERVWFKGKFKYYVPKLNDDRFIGKVEAIPIVWDINLSPYNVYQLIPWSWLLDWFSNTGDIIYNLTQISANNLVAKYAYSMRATELRRERFATWTAKCTSVIDGKYDIDYSYYGGSSHISVITKTRASASPFGFDLSLPDLSAWQVSILIALGLK